MKIKTTQRNARVKPCNEKCIKCLTQLHVLDTAHPSVMLWGEGYMYWLAAQQPKQTRKQFSF